MADKCIGKLTLDISDVEKKVKDINEFLSKIGAGVDVGKKLSESIRKELNKLVEEARKAGEEAQKALEQKNQAGKMGGLASQMEQVTNEVKTFGRALDESGNTIERYLGSVTSGLDKAGNKIKEFVNSEGDVIKRTEETGSALQQAIKLFEKLQEKEARRDVLQAQGQINTAAYAKLGEEINKIVNEFMKFDEAVRRAAASSDAGVAAERARTAQVQATINQNTEATERAVARAEEADARRAASAERAADREAEAVARATQREMAERERLTLMYRQMFDEIDARNARELDNARAQEVQKEQEQLNNLINLYREYYDFKTKAINAASSGNQEGADVFTALAHDRISEIQSYSQEMRNLAESADQVQVAFAGWQNAITSSSIKEASQATKEEQANVKAYADALVTLYNEQTKLNNAVATGKIKEGSAEYQAATDKIRNMEAAVVEAGAKTDAEGIKMANSMQNVRKAVDDLVQSQAKMNDSANVPAVDRLQTAYNNLTNAIRNYKEAERNKNESGMQYWQNQINGASATIASIENEVKTLNVDEATRTRILNLIQQSRDAQLGLTNGTKEGVTATQDMANQISGMLTRYLSIVAVIRTINNLIKSTTEYVSEYYDKMNEIRMITGKTEAEADKLGDTYRKIASDLSVSSLDVADAAIYFTRQGLGAAEVEKRIQSTTRYAKAANIEFETAAELITAVVNSMHLEEQEMEDGRESAERVADVFLKVGDNAATSGEEIGTAMQKAAAAAGAFGVEFEWLAAYIATVSETTRQEATSIGTAFNTLIARLHNIRSTGYNADDETKINDIQKALNNINVALLDQSGNWRDMTDIFNDIAGQWDTLDDKTKSYIATTMAGVKQQNVFLALMEDLSRQTEGQSRAWELHALAIDSAGTAQQKYQTYAESVTAAQERLTSAQERFYSLLNANVIKDWYNSLAGIVNAINEAADATNGWNVYIPVLAAGITGLILLVKNLGAVITALEAHPIVFTIAAVVAGITALTTVISAVISGFETAEERVDRLNKVISDMNENVNQASALKGKVGDMFESFGDGQISTKDLEKYTGLLDDVAKISPVAKEAVEQLRAGIMGQEEAFEVINGEIDTYIEKMNHVKAAAALSKYMQWNPQANGDQAALMANWGDDWHWTNGAKDPNKVFANRLKTAYYETQSFESPDGQSALWWDERYLSKEIQQEITALKNSGAEWSEIGLIIWNEIFGGIEAGADGAFNQLGEDVLQDLMTTFSTGLNDLQTLALEKQLRSMIFGDDGILSAEEYQNIGNNVSGFIKQYMLDGVASFSNMDIAKALGESLFGANMDSFFDQQGNDFAKAFVKSYEQAIRAGFSDADIVEMLKGTPIYELDSLSDIVFNKLKESVLNAFSMESFSTLFEDLDTGEVFEDTLEIFDNLDIEALKLMQDLANAGVSFEEIQTIASESSSLSEFKQRLQELGNTLGMEIPGEAEEASKSLATYAKEIKTYASEIKNIDAVLKDIEDGKTLDMQDVFNIAEAHPEILQFIKDEQTLEEALKNLRAEIEETRKASLKESILGDEGYFESTEYYQNLDDGMKQTILTMNDYLEYIGQEDEAYQIITDDIDATVDALIGMTGQTEETAKTLKDAADGVKEYSNEIKSIDSILDKIANGKTVSINDIFQLATSHPQLLQYTEDAKKLEEALKNLRAEIETDAETSVRDTLLNSTDFFKGTDYYAQLDESQKASIDTMQKYLDYLGAEDAEYAKIVDSIDKVVKGLIDMQNANDDTTKTVDDMIKEIKSSTQEMDKLDAMIKAIKKDGKVNFEDLLNLASAHPEIIGTITDIDSLIQALNRLRGTDVDSIVKNLREMMLTNKEAMEISPFSGTGYVGDDGQVHVAQTMQEILDNAEHMQDGLIASLESYLDQAVVSFLASSNQLSAVSQDILGQWMNNLFPESNVDLLNRKAVQIGDDIATVLTETITASVNGIDGIPWNQDIVCNFTPITPDGELLDEDTFTRYVEDLFANSSNLEELWNNDSVENGGRGLLISADVDFESFEEGIANAESLMELLHLLQEAYYGVTDANRTWLELQMEQAEQNEENAWAKTNGYIEQLGQLQYQLQNFGGQAALDYFNSLDETMRKGITSTYPGVLKSLAELERAMKDDASQARDLTKETKNLNKELQKSKDYADTKYFTESAKAIKGLEEGTVSATSAYNTFYKECDKVTKAQEDVTDVTAKMAKGTQVTVSDVSNLANVLGMTADEIIGDFPGAVEIFNELIGAGGDLEEMFNRLNEAAFIRITGTSECDFSALENGLLSVQDLSRETIALLQATGQWELETLTLPQEGYVFDPKTGKWHKTTINAHQTVLKPTHSNPFKGSSNSGRRSGSGSRGGGGGSGRGGRSGSSSDSSSSNDGRVSSQQVQSEIERMLYMMSQINDIQDSQRSFYQAQQKYYSQTGQIQGVIAYMQKEKEVIEAQNQTLKENVAAIEAQLGAKQAEVAAMDASAEGYKDAADDLDKLQKAHQEYTKDIIDNKTAIEALNEGMKEQQRKIRDMEIDLRKTILQAIEDREAKAQKMLSAEIEMENIIMDLIKRRYEKERDQIIDTTNLKIDSLREERDLLSEQLQLRKEQENEEDKLKELNALEEKYAKISADPTRQKEALSIRQQITKLRKEMAWDAADKEVKAQQDAIDQQITSLEDYINYVEDYYEDLFEHPKKLIEEMKSIITRTDAEIIDWLKKNSDEFIEATDNSQRQMLTGWEDTLRDMRGELKLYWDEVEDIISKGDEYIIDFLKSNSAEYAAAGKLQAEALVDQWQDKLDNLRKAHEQVTVEIAASYQAMAAAITDAINSIPEVNSSGGGYSGGGYGGGNRGGNSTPTEQRNSGSNLKSMAELLTGTNDPKKVLAQGKGPLDLNQVWEVKDNSITNVKTGVTIPGPNKSNNTSSKPTVSSLVSGMRNATNAGLPTINLLANRSNTTSRSTTTTTNRNNTTTTNRNRNTNSSRSGGCFAPGTGIRLANGQIRNIEDIRIGDLVMAYNEQTEQFEPRKVTKAYVHHDTPRMLQISFSNGVKLCITPGHPILTELGWKSRDIENSLMEHNTVASLMVVGDYVIGLFKNPVVMDIQEMDIGEHYDSYNIEVETCHTYLAEDIVVHNAKVAYASGGLADYAGLAWLDGSPELPERVLSPFQTKLFETMVQALEQMSRVSVSSMPNLAGIQGAAGNSVSVGDIIVNVDNLDTDDDYETMAERVSDILMERIGRTAVVGGLRINSL